MVRNINYIYTFRLSENPGYLDDDQWAKILSVCLLAHLTDYSPALPLEMMFPVGNLSKCGQDELYEALDYEIHELAAQESGERLKDAQFYADDMLDINVMRIGPWLKLFITIRQEA